VTILARRSAAKGETAGAGASFKRALIGGSFKHALIGALGIVAVGASFFAAPGLAGLAGAALALNMLAIAVIDWRLFIIPDQLNALALALGLLAVGFEDRGERLTLTLDAAIRGATMAALFLAFRFAYRRLRGREGMGLGDVKLAGVAGVWLDWPSLPIAVEIAALAALGFVLSRHIQARRALDPLTKLPFGAFFAPAIWFCWTWARCWS
jgi:leader peptidase (prepilin peptidase) / N-methyltransferase